MSFWASRVYTHLVAVSYTSERHVVWLVQRGNFVVELLNLLLKIYFFHLCIVQLLLAQLPWNMFNSSLTSCHTKMLHISLYISHCLLKWVSGKFNTFHTSCCLNRKKSGMQNLYLCHYCHCFLAFHASLLPTEVSLCAVLWHRSSVLWRFWMVHMGEHKWQHKAGHAYLFWMDALGLLNHVGGGGGRVDEVMLHN